MTTLSSAVVNNARHFALVTALVSVCGGLSAAEDDLDWNDLPKPMEVNDVRFGMTLLPANADISTSANGVTTYDRDSILDSAGRTSLTWMLPLGRLDEDGGFLAGLEFSRNHYLLAGTVYQPELDVKAYVGTLHLGMGWQLSRRTHLETTLFGGYGASSFIPDQYGTYWEYGVRAGLFYTFDIGFQLGLNFNYIEARMEQNYSDWSTQANQSVSYESVIKPNGAGFGGSVGWRF